MDQQQWFEQEQSVVLSGALLLQGEQFLALEVVQLRS